MMLTAYIWIIFSTCLVGSSGQEPWITKFSDRHELTIFNVEKSFNDAKSFCEERGGTLAQLYLRNSFNAVKSAVGDRNLAFWIGATDKEGTWKWLDGTSLTTSAGWVGSKPNNNGDCAIVYSITMLRDNLDCATRKRFICQRNLETRITYGSKVYFFHRLEEELSNSTDAITKCIAAGSRLATITDEGLYNALKPQLMIYQIGEIANFGRFWVEGNDDKTEGTFQTSDGTILTYLPWRDYSSNRGSRTENCICAMDDGWIDVGCETRRPFICEAAPVSIARISSTFQAASNQGSTTTCEAGGFPKPNVSWYFNGIEVKSSSSAPVYQKKEVQNATLHVEDAKFENEGTYTCIANNTINGIVYTANGTTELTVNTTATILSVVPHSCNPSLTVKLKNDRAPGIQHRISVYNGTDHVYNKNTTDLIHVTDSLFDSSLYTVFVTPCPRVNCKENEAISQAAVTGGMPNNVRNVTVNRISGKECKINWILPAVTFEKFITGYEIAVRYKYVEWVGTAEQTEQNEADVKIKSSTMEHTFEGKPNRNYSFGVKAKTCTGFGEVQWSIGGCATDKQAPDVIGEPEVSKVVTNGEVNVTLSIPNQRNGLLSCLFVIVSRNSSDNAPDQSYSIEDLRTAANSSTAKDDGDYIAVALFVPSVNVTKISVILGDGTATSCNAVSKTNNRKKRAVSNFDFAGRNPMLDETKDYSIFIVSSTPSNGEILLRRSSSVELVEKTEPETNQGQDLIIAAVISAIVVILMVIGLFIWKRKRNNLPSNEMPLEELTQGHVYEEIDQPPTSRDTGTGGNILFPNDGAYESVQFEIPISEKHGHQESEIACPGSSANGILTDDTGKKDMINFIRSKVLKDFPLSKTTAFVEELQSVGVFAQSHLLALPEHLMDNFKTLPPLQKIMFLKYIENAKNGGGRKVMSGV